MVGFGEAIDSALFKNYFNLEGKATRSEYWWFMLFFLLFNIVAGIVVGIASGIILGEALDLDSFSFYYTLLLLAVFILPILGLTVRRFHDAGRGTREAIIVFVLAVVSQFIVPIGTQGAIIEVTESIITPAWVIFVATSLYTLFIALKKSVKS